MVTEIPDRFILNKHPKFLLTLFTIPENFDHDFLRHKVMLSADLFFDFLQGFFCKLHNLSAL